MPVYSVRIAGQAVRSHADVDAAWRADNRLAIWLGALFGLFALLLFRQAHKNAEGSGVR